MIRQKEAVEAELADVKRCLAAIMAMVQPIVGGGGGVSAGRSLHFSDYQSYILPPIPKHDSGAETDRQQLTSSPRHVLRPGSPIRHYVLNRSPYRPTPGQHRRVSPPRHPLGLMDDGRIACPRPLLRGASSRGSHRCP